MIIHRTTPYLLHCAADGINCLIIIQSHEFEKTENQGLNNLWICLEVRNQGVFNRILLQIDNHRARNRRLASRAVEIFSLLKTYFLHLPA